MIKNILFLIALFSPAAFAESEFDTALKQEGIVNTNFQVVDHKRFDELMRDITIRVSSLFPSKVDAYTTILSVNVSKFGIYSNYQLDEVETRKDIEYVLYHLGMAERYQKYLCSSEFANSETFKRLNAKFNVSFLNSESTVIYTLKIPMSSC